MGLVFFCPGILQEEWSISIIWSKSRLKQSFKSFVININAYMYSTHLNLWCQQLEGFSNLECIHGILTRSPLRTLPDRFCLYFYVSEYALLTVTTTCDFERGGATKPIIGSSWNNGTTWTCIRYRNVLVLICWLFFIDYDVWKRLCNPAWSIFQCFLADTHTHTHTDPDTNALLYLCCACARGVTIVLICLWGSYTSRQCLNTLLYKPRLQCTCRSLTWNIDGMFVSSSLMHTICHGPLQRKPDNVWYSTKVLPSGPSKYLMSHNLNLHIHHM